MNLYANSGIKIVVSVLFIFSAVACAPHSKMKVKTGSELTHVEKEISDVLNEVRAEREADQKNQVTANEDTTKKPSSLIPAIPVLPNIGQSLSHINKISLKFDSSNKYELSIDIGDDGTINFLRNDESSTEDVVNFNAIIKRVFVAERMPFRTVGEGLTAKLKIKNRTLQVLSLTENLNGKINSIDYVIRTNRALVDSSSGNELVGKIKNSMTIVRITQLFDSQGTKIISKANRIEIESIDNKDNKVFEIVAHSNNVDKEDVLANHRPKGNVSEVKISTDKEAIKSDVLSVTLVTESDSPVLNLKLLSDEEATILEKTEATELLSAVAQAAGNPHQGRIEDAKNKKTDTASADEKKPDEISSSSME